MIIKGSSRGQSAPDTHRLALHWLSHENEAVEVVQLRGVVSRALPSALEEMRLITMGSRVRRGLYHASISLDRDEAPEMGTARWLEAVDELERRLGMVGHQRAVVRHIKRNREHVHVVWCRVHPTSLKLARDSQNYRKHEECSRALEARWNLRPVVGVHTRPAGTPRPVAVGTHGDWQAQERTGIPVNGVADAFTEAWRTTTTGKQFATAIQREGFQLARGRRGIVAVDDAGTPHSLPRRLQLRADQVRRRLVDIDPNTLPTVEALQEATNPKRKRNTMNTKNTTNTAFTISDARPKRGRRPADRQPLTLEYWRQLGFEVDEVGELLLIKLTNGTRLEDRGDRITLHCAGEPSDDDIRLMVSAGKARGWESIRFSGGSPEFQRRARLEALRQGYDISQISLECEDGTPKVASLMPDHIKRLVAPPSDSEVRGVPSVPDVPSVPMGGRR